MATDILLDRVERGGDAEGTSAGVEVRVEKLPTKALVFANANGSSHYQGPTANAGIILTLSDGMTTVEDDSFEGECSFIDFRAQASLMFVLHRGRKARVTAFVNPYGSGAEARNSQVKVKLHVIAIGLG